MKCIYILAFFLVSYIAFSAYLFEPSDDNQNESYEKVSRLSGLFVIFSDSSKTGSSGKSVYEKKCGICHALQSPSSYNYARWKEIMSVMKERAQLTKSENNLIMGYLKANAKK